MVDPLFRDSTISANIIRFPKFEARTPKRDEAAHRSKRDDFQKIDIQLRAVFAVPLRDEARGKGKERERERTSAVPSSFRRLQISNRPLYPPEIPRYTKINSFCPTRGADLGKLKNSGDYTRVVLAARWRKNNPKGPARNPRLLFPSFDHRGLD